MLLMRCNGVFYKNATNVGLNSYIIKKASNKMNRKKNSGIRHWNCKKLFIFPIFLLCLSGCSMVEVKREHEVLIEQYRRDGRLKQAEAEIGRTVGMGATITWSLIPGANHIHMARKIKQSPYLKDFDRDYPLLRSSLIQEGFVCSIFSIIPYVYEFSMPIQAGCTPPDVIRINNLAYMYHIKNQEKEQGDLIKELK
jgi:hypothetical protein